MQLIFSTFIGATSSLGCMTAILPRQSRVFKGGKRTVCPFRDIIYLCLHLRSNITLAGLLLYTRNLLFLFQSPSHRLCSLTMPELSYDIWLNISRYIYKDQLKELYSVNRALFEIAMDERYREVSFLCLSEKDTQRNLARLRYVVVPSFFLLLSSRPPPVLLPIHPETLKLHAECIGFTSSPRSSGNQFVKKFNARQILGLNASVPLLI